MSLPAGKLKDKIKIQQEVLTTDGLGQRVKTWQDYAEAWSWVKFKAGFEGERADQNTSFSYCTMRIRYRRDIVPNSMRAILDSKLYNIIDVMPHDGREYIDLVCTNYIVQS